jgi:hypothetical protein
MFIKSRKQSDSNTSERIPAGFPSQRLEIPVLDRVINRGSFGNVFFLTMSAVNRDCLNGL